MQYDHERHDTLRIPAIAAEMARLAELEHAPPLESADTVPAPAPSEGS